MEGLYGFKPKKRAYSEEELARYRKRLEEYAREESGTTQQAKIGEWAQGHIIERPSSPGVNRALEQIRAYTPDVVVVDDPTLQAHRPNALGLTSDGTIYLSDAIPEELSVVVPSHEIVHLLKQRKNKIYQ